MSGQEPDGIAMPEDPRADPERVVDALEEKIGNEGAEPEPERESDEDTDAADGPGIDPGTEDASTMHSAGEPPA